MVAFLYSNGVGRYAGLLDDPFAVIGHGCGAEGGALCFGEAERVTSWLLGPVGSCFGGPTPMPGSADEGGLNEPRAVCSEMSCLLPFSSFINVFARARTWRHLQNNAEANGIFSQGLARS